MKHQFSIPASVQGKYAVIISAYSLAQGKVGEHIPGSTAATICDTGETALVLLDKELGSKNRHPMTGYTFLIHFPDGSMQPFNTAYQSVFGQAPIKRDNKESLYPCLKKYIAKRK